MILVYQCKLNRFYRRAMVQNSWDLDLTEEETNDWDNMFAGCAFE